MDCSPLGSSVHGDSPGKNSGVGCGDLLQGSSPPRGGTRLFCLLHWQRDHSTMGETEQHYFSYPSSSVSSGRCKITVAFSYLKYNIRNQRSSFHFQFIWIPDGHILKGYVCVCVAHPGGSEVKASAWNAGDPGLIPGSGRSPGEGNGNPLQSSCLENPMEGGAW